MSTTEVLDRYGRRFGLQERREERRTEVVPNPVVDEICRRYEMWLPKVTGDKGKDNEESREAFRYIHTIKGKKISSEVVRDFSLRLRDYQEREKFWVSGLFLSALVDKSRDENFEILLENLKTPIGWVGYRNKKRVKVFGDLVGNTCLYMTDGEFVVDGNGGGCVGQYMKGGKIKIHGNATTCVGAFMTGGRIDIAGDVGDGLGFSMGDGEIWVDGAIGSIEAEGGKIYHKGKLIWPIAHS